MNDTAVLTIVVASLALGIQFLRLLIDLAKFILELHREKKK